MIVRPSKDCFTEGSYFTTTFNAASSSEIHFSEWFPEKFGRRKQLKDLANYATQAGLSISTTKTKVMSMDTTPTAIVTLNGEPFKFVEDFTYLGSLISKDSGADEDIKARLGKARCTFVKLQNISKSKQFTMRTNKPLKQ